MLLSTIEIKQQLIHSSITWSFREFTEAKVKNKSRGNNTYDAGSRVAHLVTSSRLVRFNMSYKGLRFERKRKMCLSQEH